MSYPPSYKTTTSEEYLADVVKNLTVEQRNELLKDRKSISSAISDDGSIIVPRANVFNGSRTLIINARGMDSSCLGNPSKELQIQISNPDGTLAYTSTREKRSSGNAVLSSPVAGNLVASYYRFGPGRPPTLEVLGARGEAQITTSEHWFSRQLDFSFPAATTQFHWRYQREKLADGAKKINLLVLEVSGPTKEPVRVAQLVRDGQTRTAGTSKWSAGNGGHLLIDPTAARTSGLTEEMIVSTALMMLKREMDRKRSGDIAAVTAAAG